MKIVIASDLHGNLESLDGLPSDYDELWVLGDLVNYGPNPAEVVDFVQSRASVVVRGNHDNAIGYGTDPKCSPAYRNMAAEMARVTEALLSERQKQYLRDLPLIDTQERGDKRFFLCHAAPSDPLYEYCPPDSTRWPEQIEIAAADFLLVGHTHLPFIRNVGVRTVVNPGSLGQAKTGAPEACYAIWNGSEMSLHTRPYDFEATIRKLAILPISDDVKRSLALVLRTGHLPGQAR